MTFMKMTLGCVNCTGPNMVSVTSIEAVESDYFHACLLCVKTDRDIIAK